MTARARWMRIIGPIGFACAAGCDISITDSDSNLESIALARVVGPGTPMALLAVSEKSPEVLWVEADKDQDTGQLKTITKLVYVTERGGEQQSLTVTFDPGGLPHSIIDESGNVLRFTRIDRATGAITMELVGADGNVLSGPRTTFVDPTTLDATTERLGQVLEECADDRDRANISLINWAAQTMDLFACLVISAFAFGSQTWPALTGAIVACGQSIINSIISYSDNQTHRFLSSLVSAGLCSPGIGMFSCASSIISVVRLWLSNDCSYVGGRWHGRERYTIRGTIVLPDSTMPIDESDTVAGTIDIEQRGGRCEIRWFVEGMFIRQGSVERSTITVSGAAGGILGATVVQEHENSFTASGNVCGDRITLRGNGRFRADVQTTEGAGVVDVTIQSQADLADPSSARRPAPAEPGRLPRLFVIGASTHEGVQR